MLHRFSQVGSLIAADSEERLGAHHFKDNVKARALEFKKAGVRELDRILLLHGNSIAFFVDIFALWELNACVVPIDESNPRTEVLELAKICGAAFLLERNSLQPLPGDRPQEPKGNLILFTSGSSGRPKGVVHDFLSIENRLGSLAQNIPPSDRERTLCVLPTHFGHGLIGNCLFPFLQGGDLCIGRPINPTQLAKLAPTLDAHEITFFSSVPSLWRLLEGFTAPKKKTLRRLHCASATFSEELIPTLRDWAGSSRIYNVYGLTELASWVSGHEIAQSSDAAFVGTGWGVNFRIEGADANGVGLLEIQSKGRALEYLGDKELSREKFQGEWVHTGDLARLDPLKGIMLKGRSDDVINRGGWKVYPDEVEAVLQRNEAVNSACVFGLPHDLLGELVVAVVQCRANASVKPEELENWCRSLLPSYRVPSRWHMVAELPRNSRGKVSRAELKNLFREGS